MKTYLKPIIYQEISKHNDFKEFIIKGNYSSVIVLVDKNTKKYCLPHIKECFGEHTVHVIPSGEENKTISSCVEVWGKLTDANIDRKAVIVNLGGGVICDMGGFIASIYKRGIDFINIPTTLLAMCDACLGGKSAVNLNGFKNQIGVFNNPKSIFINVNFLKTLPEKQIISGFAEVIKHSLIGNIRFFNELYNGFDLKNDIEYLIARSLKIKSRIVNLDLHEKGVRKSLNFGHSIGHALESFSLMNHSQSPIYHGEAIAVGIIAESWISMKRKYLNAEELNKICILILRLYPKIKIEKADFTKIIENVSKDKKNEHNFNLFTLLNGIGQFRINEKVSKQEIIQSLEYYISL